MYYNFDQVGQLTFKDIFDDPARRFDQQATALQVLEGQDLSDKSILITGCSKTKLDYGGLGAETARALALKGAHVIMACRDLNAAQEVKTKILRKKVDAKLDILECDLASLASVKRAAEKFIENDWPLDVLILNAGVYFPSEESTANGFERCFGVNHLGHFYLTTLLLPRLRQSAPARVVVVSSHLHSEAQLPLRTDMNRDHVADYYVDNLIPTKFKNASKLTKYRFYARSKLCNVLFTKALNRKEAGLVNANVLHTGRMKTTNIGGVYETYTVKSLERGAATTVFCAAAPEMEGKGGKYLVDCWFAPVGDNLARDVQLQDALWTRSRELILNKMNEIVVRRFDQQATALQVVEGQDLSDRTILITGCSSGGIGAETARVLALKGAHVIMACRDLNAAQNVKTKILGERVDAKLDILECDLASLASVKRAAEEFIENDWPLDVLILNAGVFFPSEESTADGFERCFGVNHLAHFHLTTLLLPRLRQSAPARVVVVSSQSQSDSRLPTARNMNEDHVADYYVDNLIPTEFENAGFITKYRFYARSKFCNVLFAFALNRMEAGLVNANVLHPGLIKTEIYRDVFIARLGMFLVARPFRMTKNLEQGAATTVFCAAAPEMEGVGGQYLVDCWFAPVGDNLARNVQLQEALWTRSRRLIEDKQAQG